MNENLMTQGKSLTGEYHESRELSEIKGKMFLARQFPRNPDEAMTRVLQECARPELAQAAQYEYPKGDSVVRGPSIRLVEVLARNWGNVTYGVDEIDSTATETTIKTYAWDLESNVSDVKMFSVKHERSTKKGAYKITDERDIYEMVANKGARRKRACLLSVLPGWYVEAAVDKCEKTLKNSLTQDKSIEEVRASAVQSFEEFGITSEQIEAKIGRPVDKLTENDIVKLRHLYLSIKDGFVKPADAFDLVPTSTDAELPSDDEQAALDELNKALGGKDNGTD